MVGQIRALVALVALLAACGGSSPAAESDAGSQLDGAMADATMGADGGGVPLDSGQLDGTAPSDTGAPLGDPDASSDAGADLDAGPDGASPDGGAAVDARSDDADMDGVLVGDDCDDSNPAIGAASAWYPDRDLDGHGQRGSVSVIACTAPEQHVATDDDCDDASDDIYPGAQEVCNDFDDDCDGRVDNDDDDTAGVLTYYRDGDRDTYGSDQPADAFVGCEGTQAASFVLRAGDCDDGDVAVNPEAAEVCGDNVDNDCEGTIDRMPASGGTSFYQDGDRDGYGTSAGAVIDCVNPDPMRYAARDGDCDDAAPTVYPGAPDTPDRESIDANCDGLDGEADAASTYFVASPADTCGCSDAVPPRPQRGGTRDRPFCTIEAALRAGGPSGGSAPRTVLISGGSYSVGQPLFVRPGTSLHGDYRCRENWRREPNATRRNGTVIQALPMARAAVVIDGSGVTSTARVLLERLVIRGPNLSAQPGATSYGAYVVGMGAPNMMRDNVRTVLRDSQVDGGQGGTGANGLTPPPSCDRADGGAGGQPGDPNVHPASQFCYQETPEAMAALGPRDGQVLPGGGSPGPRGSNGRTVCLCSWSLDGPSAPLAGNPGGRGSHATSGGMSSSSFNGAFTMGAPPFTRDWVGGRGGPGADGAPGGGGGGGGAGGSRQVTCPTCAGWWTGGHGGRGGDGGCGGRGGDGGQQGGASFAVVAIGTDVVLDGVSLSTGAGGTGGRGGDGGGGQSGVSGQPGSGRFRGPYPDQGCIECVADGLHQCGGRRTYDGAPGGDGGDGGNGSGGAGGNGGPAACVVLTGGAIRHGQVGASDGFTCSLRSPAGGGAGGGAGGTGSVMGATGRAGVVVQELSL